MSKIGFLKTDNSITLIFNNQTKVIAKGDDRFEKILAAVREGRDADIPEIVDPTAQFAKAGIEVEDGLLKVEGEAMPSELNSRILDYKSNNLPYQSLLNFWTNLKKNPSFNSRQQLFKFLSNHGHSITEDGCFVGYRGISEDFKDRHTGKWDNSPGQVCKMARENVDDNPNNTCSHGLHVGGYEYAKSFGPKLVMVKVNPKDVVAVPNDYNGQKMRVCQFEVLCETAAPSKEAVVSAKGGKATGDVPKLNLALAEEVAARSADGALAKAVGEAFDQDAKRSPTKFGTVTGLRTKAQERAHKRRYANNHAKRDKNGKFMSKKRRK